MVDIHCHILHGVDDGSGNLTDSLEMAQLAVKNGTKTIFATPHCNMPHYFENFMSTELEQRLSALQKMLDERNVGLTVYCGHEIYLAEGFLQRLKKSELVTLNRSRYPLVEFDFYEQASDAYRKIEMLVSEGYVPIVAHPERYAFVNEDEYAVGKLRRCGALIQLNSGSFSGSFGRKPAVTAENILYHQLADFVASDAHSQYSRTPDLSQAHEFVCENFSYDYANVLFRINPGKVINDDEIR
ncbi:MAG: CpsB/CapC family capsule biosynthesis tyrosine phosphatase [Acutalibacteraceae bacterium]|nr:CpsB/CapC family capsule biosynthesis tyrosine phosphatase [Acutalibacteraceae bacterium]